MLFDHIRQDGPVEKEEAVEAGMAPFDCSPENSFSRASDQNDF